MSNLIKVHELYVVIFSSGLPERLGLLMLFWLISDTAVTRHLGTVDPENSFHHPEHIFFLRDYQVTDQSDFAFQRFTQPNAKCLAVVEGDYTGLVSVVNDQAANYSFDYKGPGQKWLPN